MPTVFRQNGLRFHFFSNEGTPREPMHIHVVKGGREAKFWTGEAIELAYNHGLDRRELAMALMIGRARRRELQEAWLGYFQ